MKLKIFKIRLTEEHQAEDERRVNTFLNQVVVIKSETALITLGENYWSIVYHYKDPPKASVKQKKVNTEKLLWEKQVQMAKQKAAAELIRKQAQKKAIEVRHLKTALKNWRKEQAKEEETFELVILVDSQIEALINARPTTKEMLLKVKGFNTYRVEKYGDDILSIFNTSSKNE